ncbi:MAG TPA: YdcF family protein [Patescibacteria group bacterium]|nr:YdcF family protein [Patescibacteria group bacterium]
MIKKSEKIIVILGGGLKKEKNGLWRTTRFTEGDNFGVSGDYIRIYAAYYLVRKLKDYLIIAVGGRGQLKKIKGAPAVSQVLKKELIDLGVPKNKILLETKSGKTSSQLWELAKILKQRKITQINLISNGYHLPRIKAMIDHVSELKKAYKKIKINFISAEKVIIAVDRKKWDRAIKTAYRSKALKERIKLEKQGITDLKKGVYKFN